MNKEDFLYKYCPDFEDWNNEYDYYKDYLDYVNLDNYEFRDSEDFGDAVETELAYEIFETICSNIYGDDFYDENQDLFDDWNDDEWSYLSIRNNGVEVNIPALIEAIEDAMASADRNCPKPKFNPLKIEHDLNTEYKFKFIVNYE